MNPIILQSYFPANILANIQAIRAVYLLMSKRIALVWFTTDLRLRDNELLHAALQRHDAIIPVYCFDWEDMQKEQFGFKRTGARRLKFLLESLIDLQQSLVALNAELQVVSGKAEEIIPRLSLEYGVTEVFAKKEVGAYELAAQSSVSMLLSKIGVERTVLSTSTLFHPNDLPFGVRDIPEVFTDFRKRAERDADIRKEFARPVQIPTPDLPPTSIPTLASLNIEEQRTDERGVLHFRGGEE